jgi:uncharacterized protein
MGAYDWHDFEELNRAECLSLLRDESVGRVGVSVGTLPAIFPVNYAMDEEDIVFRTGPGTKLDAAVRNNVVAFEVDGIDRNSATGWSVLAQGTASQILDGSSEIRQAMKLDLDPWAGGKYIFVRIPTQLLTGRRITGGQPHVG